MLRTSIVYQRVDGWLTELLADSGLASGDLAERFGPKYPFVYPKNNNPFIHNRYNKANNKLSDWNVCRKIERYHLGQKQKLPYAEQRKERQ